MHATRGLKTVITNWGRLLAEQVAKLIILNALLGNTSTKAKSLFDTMQNTS
jgi:hypothetical protein